MSKKLLMAALLLTAALSVTACGKETETGADVSAESPSVESSSNETETQDSTDEDSQSAEEPEDSVQETSQPTEEADEESDEEASTSYIFSDMPVAAYEVTGLGVGRSESIYEEDIVDGSNVYHIPLVKLTPGENTFILFCMEGDDAGEYSVSASAIQSPSGSSKWEAVTYTCLDMLIDPVPEGCSILARQETDKYAYDEATYSGCFFSLVDPWLDWIRFAEIYHSDAQQDDTIYVIDVAPSIYDEEYDDVDEMLAGMEHAFDVLGGKLKEIPVEEALKRCSVTVSEGGAN